jgi:hypothetical protein
MNLFVLDPSPEAAARAHCNKHAVKMIVETAQVLSTVLHLKGETVAGLYRATHRSHPCTLWAAERWSNFRWAVKLGLALCAEYTERYGKRHKTQDLLEALEVWSRRGGSDTRIAFQFVGPDDCQVREGDTEFLDVVESYRKLYRLKDRKMAMVWPAGRRPEWMGDA